MLKYIFFANLGADTAESGPHLPGISGRIRENSAMLTLLSYLPTLKPCQNYADKQQSALLLSSGFSVSQFSVAYESSLKTSMKYLYLSLANLTWCFPGSDGSRSSKAKKKKKRQQRAAAAGAAPRR